MTRKTTTKYRACLRRTGTAVLASLAVLAAGIQPADAGCSLRSLKGDYLFRSLGVEVSGNTYKQSLGMEVPGGASQVYTGRLFATMTFNGIGGWSGGGTRQEVNWDGAVTTTTSNYSGTYTVSGCTATLVGVNANNEPINDGKPVTLEIVARGQMFIHTGDDQSNGSGKNELGIGVRR